MLFPFGREEWVERGGKSESRPTAPSRPTVFEKRTSDSRGKRASRFQSPVVLAALLERLRPMHDPQSTGHRRSYADEPGLCDRVFELLDTWIPALSSKRHTAAAALGSRWEDCSIPFVQERDGRLLAHVGLLDTRLRCGSEVLEVGGVHAVYTRPEEGRRGLYRELIEEVLALCDERYPAVKLSTEHP